MGKNRKDKAARSGKVDEKQGAGQLKGPEQKGEDRKEPVKGQQKGGKGQQQKK